MTSIINEIYELRNGLPIEIDYENTNRYRIVVSEVNGTKTDYYFTAPIYNDETKKIVDIKFHKNNDEKIYSIGSNSFVTYSEYIRMENSYGACDVFTGDPAVYKDDHTLCCEKSLLFPTTNGFVYKAFCKNNRPFTFSLETSKPFTEIRGNNKYFSIMCEKFRPFVTVSCIGTVDSADEIVAPARISFRKNSDCKYTITVIPCSPFGEYVLFEINLYEIKFVQDTTVESANPNTNNVYTSSAFIGETAEFGETWFYSRPDTSKMTELIDKRILKATMHLPKFSSSNIELSAYKVAARFCSFGSTWNNKIPVAQGVSDSDDLGNYLSFNVTGMFSDYANGSFASSNGVIIKTKNKNTGFGAVATGDSCFAPQIFEINYKD